MIRATSHSLWLTFKTPLTAICLISALLFTSSCSLDDDDDGSASTFEQTAIARAIFDPTVTNFTVKVYYELGAAPYTGALLTNDTWDVTEQSYQDLFSTHVARTVTVPHVIGDMQIFPDRNRATWGTGDLIALGQSFDFDFKSGTEITVPVIFVRGLFNGSANILGVHFTGLPFAFVFKDVVEAVGGTADQQRYVEQAVVVHELGHLVGLVDNGVPMVTPHEDPAHRHHSTNDDCVMYFRAEASGDILGIVADYILGNRISLFGPESLQDGRAYKP